MPNTSTTDDNSGPRASSIPAMISLKTLAKQLDCHRYSVQRWLTDAGIHPITLGPGKKGAIRYELSEVEEWLRTRHRVNHQ